MIKWTLIILFLLAVPYAMAQDLEADTYKPNEVLDLSVHLSDTNGNVEAATCYIQVRNNSFHTIVDGTMEEIGGGWYNYTYNTSETGYYHCRQNCTDSTRFIAGTCDFIIEGDERMSLAILLVVMAVIAFYFILLWMFHSGVLLKEHGILKIALMVLVLWMSLIPLNMAMEFNIFNGGPLDVTDNLVLVYRIMIYVNYAISFYMIIYFIIQMIQKLRGAVKSGS